MKQIIEDINQLPAEQVFKETAVKLIARHDQILRRHSMLIVAGIFINILLATSVVVILWR